MAMADDTKRSLGAIVAKLLDQLADYDELLDRSELPGDIRTALQRMRDRTARAAADLFEVEGEA